jgi:hypothetical protein
MYATVVNPICQNIRIRSQFTHCMAIIASFKRGTTVMQEQTPMDVLQSHTRDKHLDEKQPQRRVVLLTTGSMNPIHTGHVKQLELAAAHLQQQGLCGGTQVVALSNATTTGVCVCAAWLSVSDAGWASGKPHGCFSNETKVRLCSVNQIVTVSQR